MDYLVEQAEALVANGAKELILVAQETTVYGTDIYGKKALPELLHKLGQIEDLKWIRILYCYPEEINDELIQAIKNEPKVCHYLDMPIQHASDAILKRMGRRTSRQELIDIITKLRKEIPDIALRTTLITGFPGETKQDHEQMMEFVDSMEFDRLGALHIHRKKAHRQQKWIIRLMKKSKNSGAMKSWSYSRRFHWINQRIWSERRLKS